MLSCKQVTRLLSERQDRDLGFGERLTLRLHLSICDGCTAVNRQFDFLRRAVRQLSSGDDERGN